MDRETTRLYAQITKLNLLMELIWAEELFMQGKAPDDIPRIADRAIAKWELFSPRAPGETVEYHEEVSAQLAQFFAQVHQRVGQIYAEGRGRQSPPE